MWNFIPRMWIFHVSCEEKTAKRIPRTASELRDLFPTTTFGVYYKYTVRCGANTGVVFYSEQMDNLLSEITNIQFDGTFLQSLFSFISSGYICCCGKTYLTSNSLPVDHKESRFYQASLQTIGMNLWYRCIRK